jgi:hypothetical protein
VAVLKSRPASAIAWIISLRERVVLDSRIDLP